MKKSPGAEVADKRPLTEIDSTSPKEKGKPEAARRELDRAHAIVARWKID